jgi:ribosomal protein L37AE/L43A
VARLYTLFELLTRFGLEVDTSGNMDCPFCGEKKKLHIKPTGDKWRCPKCESSGKVLHFFSMYQLGQKLGESKKERREVWKLLSEFMGDSFDSPSRNTLKAPPSTFQIPCVPVASDNHLDAVYRVIQGMPELRLTPEHRAALLKRGLTDAVIARNGYCSISRKTPIPPYIVDIYDKEGGNGRLRKVAHWISPQLLQLGLLIGQAVAYYGLTPQGVPGFFKFGSQWCYYCIPGLMIPTRNIAGQIVIWQVRCDEGNIKYKTVSKADLPGHVTEKVSRCHFPLGNAPLNPKTKVVITEGPLKGDVACHLIQKQAIYACVPGVSTIEDFLANARHFRKAGITEVLDAFDMDKLANPNVMRSCSKLHDALRRERLRVRNWNWDEDYAYRKLNAMYMVAKHHGVQLPPIKTQYSVFDKLGIVCSALSSKGISTYVTVPAKKRGQKDDKVYWDPSTKGIDDYALTVVRKKQ